MLSRARLFFLNSLSVFTPDLAALGSEKAGGLGRLQLKWLISSGDVSLSSRQAWADPQRGWTGL